MENIKALNLGAGNINDKTDNEFEQFLWKRAKKVETEQIKKNNNFLFDVKRNLTPSETVSSISGEIEEYMVNYLKTMAFVQAHSNEISDFFKKNLIKN